MAPPFEFPAPVLSVAIDVVRELEGGEALTGLWTLFTKCKASLEDGHRLENISWRLWHRELVATTPRPGHISDSEHDGDSNRLLNENEKTALGTEQGDNYPDMQHMPSTHVPLPPTSSPPSHPKSPTVTTIGSVSTRCNNSFGKIIIDMLPNTLPPTTSHPCKEASAQTDSLKSPLSYFILTQSTAPAPVADTHSLPIHCHLPTPAASELHLMPPSTHPAQSSLGGPVPHVQVQIDPASPSTPPSTLPQLVIVHPTPGPTPHPTPPTSPILGFGTTSGNPKSVEAVSPVATTVSPSPKFTLHAEGSVTSSSSDSSSTSGRTNTFSLSATTTSTDSRVTVAAVAQQSKHLAKANGPSSTHIAAPPPPSSTSTTASPMPQPPPTPAPMVRKAHSSPTARLSPTPAPDTESSRARPRAPGCLRQTSSTSSAGGGGSHSKGKDERSKSKSRSRSRGRGADGPARAGLMMTSASGKRSSAATGSGQRGRAVGLRKGASGKGGTTARTTARDKRPTFNIGSHSDDVGSKSGGSGSSVSRAGNGTQQVEEGKKEKQNALAPPQRQQSTSKLMPPPLRHPLPDPATVLPSKQQQPKRTIVLSTSDSDDYETETDVTESDSEHGGDGAGRVEVEEEGDTADWSSEDMSTDDVEFVRRGGVAQPGLGHDTKVPVQPQHRSNSTANIATTHHNHTHHTTHTRQQRPQHPQHLSRVQQSRRNHAANAQYIVEQAALEAERIREMFAKKPVPSSEDLAKQRTRSVGLLTQLMHPDPEIFPPSHPYRRGHSSGDVKGTRGLGPFGGGLAMTRASGDASEAGERTGQGLGQGQASTRGDVQPPLRRASAGPAPGMKLSKSAAAIPVASQVQVGSVSSVPREQVQGNVVMNGSGKGGMNGVYRPKGRPVDQEMEDTESEGESGDAANGILVSKSVAQEKLKALAERRGIVPHDRKEEDPVPDWVRASEKKGRRTTSLGEYPHSRSDASISQREQQQSQAPTPTPIPLGHPYHLPPAAPPSTPRTTRRLMLQTEMSESLRRNLLWERQVSKVNLSGRRSSSGAGPGRNGGTVLSGGPLKPLTALRSMVQLTAKQPGPGSGSGNNTSPREGERNRPGSGGPMEEEQEREERKKRALARNRSWANEFHYTGW